jgi:hypothetical protein
MTVDGIALGQPDIEVAIFTGPEFLAEPTEGYNDVSPKTSRHVGRLVRRTVVHNHDAILDGEDRLPGCLAICIFLNRQGISTRLSILPR